MKKPEEIKKGLEACVAGECHSERHECPYRKEAECTMALSKDALAYIQQLEAQVPKWISVEERLPEDGLDPTVCSHFKSIKVMVAIKAKNGWTVRTQTRFKETRYPRGKAITTWMWKHSAGEVTHWMPLPEPPKEW